MTPKKMTLLVCVVAAAAAFGYFVIRDFAVTVFYGYLLVAASIVAVAGARVFKRDPLSPDSVVSQLIAGKGMWKRISAAAIEVVGTIQLALAWPSTLVLLYRGLRPLAGQLDSQGLSMGQHLSVQTELSEASQYLGSVDTSCLTTVWFLLIETGRLRSGYAIALLYVFVSAVMVRHIASLWIPDGVIAGFKRSEGSPLFRFLIVVFCDLATLVLAFSAIKATSGSKVGIVQLRSTASGLISLNETVPKMFLDGLAEGLRHLRGLPASEHLLLAAGLLMYVVLVKAAKGGFKQFERTDSDHLAIANTLIAKGKYDKALDEIAKLHSFGSSSEDMRITPLLARGSYEKAEQCARRTLELDPRINTEVTVNDVYWVLFTKAMNLPKTNFLRVWQDAVRDHVAGSMLWLAGVRWLQDEEMTNRLMDGWEVGTDPYRAIPAAYLHLLFRQDAETALLCLGEAVPAQEHDRFSHISCRLMAKIALGETSEDRRGRLDAWVKEEGESFLEQAKKILEGGYWAQFLVYWTISTVQMFSSDASPDVKAWMLTIKEEAHLTLSKTDSGAAASRVHAAITQMHQTT